MPQGVGYPTLEEDMLAQTAPPQLPGATGPVAGASMDGAPQVQDDLRSQLSPMVEGPVEDFLVELMAIADEVGILDDAFGEESVEDQVDLQDINSDPMELLNRGQLESLVQKYMAIPEPERSQLGEKLAAELPPQVADRLAAIIRMFEGRDTQQVVAP
jgi:hypothetical protein